MYARAKILSQVGETTLCTTALDLQSEDYESKTYKPLEENPLLLSEPSMFYRYLNKLRSHSKVVSPRWLP